MTKDMIYEALRKGEAEKVLEYLTRSDLIHAVNEGWMTLEDATATYEYIMNI